MALTISGALHHPRFNENADIPKVDDGRGGWYRCGREVNKNHWSKGRVLQKLKK
jgi:hypothetical protein